MKTRLKKILSPDYDGDSPGLEPVPYLTVHMRRQPVFSPFRARCLPAVRVMWDIACSCAAQGLPQDKDIESEKG